MNGTEVTGNTIGNFLILTLTKNNPNPNPNPLRGTP